MENEPKGSDHRCNDCEGGTTYYLKVVNETKGSGHRSGYCERGTTYFLKVENETEGSDHGRDNSGNDALTDVGEEACCVRS